MYPSDYGFSVSSENDNWEKQLKDFSSIKSSSWMNSMLSNGGWLLSPGSNDSRGVADWHTVGYVDNNNADNVVCVRPSVNLISEIKIIQGDGTSGSPYFLEL